MRYGKLLAMSLMAAGLAPGAVQPEPVPDGGVQPQVAVDARGVVHMIYMKGDPGASDVYYVRRAPRERAFSRPMRVNSQPGSAIATGTIRGARLALGRNGRVHVAWNGSNRAEPKGPQGAVPMLYARLNDAGTAFEPQRNLMQSFAGLDGGGTVAADQAGHVYVAWHAKGTVPGEAHRRVYVARSDDDGRTFTREAPAWDDPTGACGCCGLSAFARGNADVYLFYRAATEDVERDMYLLVSHDAGRTFHGARVDRWHLNACPMSSSDIVADGREALVAWQTEKQVYFAKADPLTLRLGARVAAPGAGNRKFPAMAVNARGESILVWADGTGWKKGGALEWQVYDANGRPTAERGELAGGVPEWSLPAVFARPDGGFTILH